MPFEIEQLSPLITREAESAAEKKFKEMQADVLYGVNPVPIHTHNGTDSSQVSFINLADRTILIPYTISGTNAATAANYSTFFIAPYAMTVQQIQEVHAVKGTDASAVTLNVEKLTGTTAPGAGTALLTSTIDLKGTINTVVTGSLTQTITSNQLASGDRLALVLSGTPTSVANVTITIILGF